MLTFVANGDRHIGAIETSRLETIIRRRSQFSHSMELLARTAEYVLMNPLVNISPPATSRRSDQHVVDAEAHRRREDFRRLFDAQIEVLLRYVHSRVGGETCDDIVSQTFEEAWRTFDKFSPERGSQTAWLLGIATNMISRHRDAEQKWLRASQAARRLATDPSAVPPSMESALIDTEARRARNQRLMTSVARLSPKLRDPLLLHILGELSYQDVSRALSVPIGTVRSRINRARKKISEGGVPS